MRYAISPEVRILGARNSLLVRFRRMQKSLAVLDQVDFFAREDSLQYWQQTIVRNRDHSMDWISSVKLDQFVVCYPVVGVVAKMKEICLRSIESYGSSASMCMI